MFPNTIFSRKRSFLTEKKNEVFWVPLPYPHNELPEEKKRVKKGSLRSCWELNQRVGILPMGHQRDRDR